MSKRPMTIAPYQGLATSSSHNPETLTSSPGLNPLQIQRPSIQRNVPAFLNKLYNMVDDESTNELIRWSEDGASFIVVRHEDFARKVLPRFFKHSNFSSFVRQLNMYGFHKVPHLQQGVLQTDDTTERWEFDNPHFQRNQPDLLLLVTRKKGRDHEDKEVSGIDLHNVLDEIQAIKKHQTTISTQLQSIQRDNQILWQETVAARERHQRHQETIDKILRFLASVFTADKSVTIPSRKRQYLLESSDDHVEKESESERPAKISRHSSPRLDASSSHDRDTTDIILPTSPLSLDTYPSSELADAIALNDQSKATDQAHQQIDASQLFNVQQLQSLQNFINMAQTNPAFINQLTNESTASPSFNLPSAGLSTMGYPALDPSMLSALTYASDGSESTNLVPSLSQTTNSMMTLSKTANAINQDIDALGSDIETLASQLGFDPTKYTEDDNLNLDEFLNTFVSTSSTPGSPVDSPSLTEPKVPAVPDTTSPETKLNNTLSSETPLPTEKETPVKPSP